MTGRAGEPPMEIGPWSALTARFSPFLDAAIALVATVLSVASLVTTDVASVDPRLHSADPLAIAATTVAGLSLAWRRTRPIASFSVFVLGCLVVTLTDHYIGLLS